MKYLIVHNLTMKCILIHNLTMIIYKKIRQPDKQVRRFYQRMNRRREFYIKARGNKQDNRVL